jgi:predicted fused transcriptional regulator/phosphomethylpyrimidine kinase
MVSFAIIELNDGFAVVTVQPDQSPEEAATKEHGTLVDPGPYATYEDAYDAICELEGEGEEATE